MTRSLPKTDRTEDLGVSCALGSPLPPLIVESAAQFTHCLLFVQEFTKATAEKKRDDFAPISFFLHRSGGFHLLLLLLNVAFYKRSAGRTKGWPFGVLAARVEISRRSLRQLLADAISKGLVERRSGHRDKRRVVYCATPKVVDAWQRLFDDLNQGLAAAFSEFGSATLVDIDYSRFDPRRPAQSQIPPPADSLYLKSADPTPTVATADASSAHAHAGR